MTRYRRLRAPVFSRLTMAWTVFACAGVIFGGYSFLKDEEDTKKVALSVDGDIETMAPPITRLAPPVDASRTPSRGTVGPTLANATLTSPHINELADQARFSDDDIYADLPTLVSVSPENSTKIIYPNDENGDKVVITVDGEPARRPGERLALAKVQPVFERGKLTSAPIASLLKKTAHGQIPRISPTGKRASKTYAKPFETSSENPKIALVIGGLGLNAALTERAIDNLPAEVTLAFAPYAKDLSFWAEKARAAGHEVVLELPMEAHNGAPEALGPAALLTKQTSAENLERLDWLLSRFKGYFAATNYRGGKFSADPEAVRPILEKLREAGVAYIDDTGAIRRSGVKGEWTIVNRVLTASDRADDPQAVKSGLEALEKIARRDGNALGKTFAYDASIDEIVDWAAELSGRGFTIAPASTILHARGPIL